MDSDALTGKQEQLVELLLSGTSITASAKQLHVNESTCHRWLKLPHLQAELRRARRRLYEQRMSVLLSGVGIALKTLMEGMDSSKTRSEFVRMSSAAKWLELCAQVLVDAQRDEQMTELEAILEDLKGKVVPHGQIRRLA